MECKKAQPKEAVQASAQLLGKRLMLSGLGMRMATPGTGPMTAANQLAVVQAQAHVQAAAAAAAAAQAQSAAVAGYGKIFGAYPPLASYRYAPYPIPTAVGAGAAAAAAAAGQPTPAPPAAAAPAAALAPPVAASPYQGYNLTNVDMSSFQGVDWGSMYGMGMYV